MRALLTAILIIAIVREARADCVGLDLCKRFDYASTVFLADVIDVKGGTVTFDVLEGFKHARRGRTTLPMVIKSWEDDRRFKVGERLLVYLGRTPEGGYWAGGCAGTRPLEADDSEPVVLRHFARGDVGARVSGGLWPADSNWYRRPDARVTIRPVSGHGATLTTTSNGWSFEFAWVRPGLHVMALEGNRRYGPQRHLVRVGYGDRCVGAPGFRIRER
jgi:hypothetical protein